ncbi:MAG: hypothetical protein RIQ54_362 [Candidatus Parcubacteria bacterium]|jgi:hypothetical protein
MHTFESIPHQSDSSDSHSRVERPETFEAFQQQVRERIAHLSEYVSGAYDDFTESDLAVLNVEDMYQWKAVTQLEELFIDPQTPFNSDIADKVSHVTKDFETYREALLSADSADPSIKSRLAFSRILGHIIAAMPQRRLLKDAQENPVSHDDVRALRRVLNAQIKGVVDRFKSSGDQIIPEVDRDQSSIPRHVDDSQIIQ